MPPYIIVVILISTGEAFDVELQSDGEWNEIRQAVRTNGFITLRKWRKNNNPPRPGSGPFTDDNDLIIPSEGVYLGVGDLRF